MTARRRHDKPEASWQRMAFTSTLGSLFLLTALRCFAADLPGAERLLLTGHADAAGAALRAALAENPQDGQAHLLLCRVFYAEAMPDQAEPECAAAVAALPSSSDAEDWMGRVYGGEADRSGPMTGLRLAHRVKNAFEQAVVLDANNAAAVNDLGEYYIGAPAIVGGGLDKAEALARRSMARLPQAAHRLLAMAAEKNKDYGTAEREFRAAVAVANRPEAWVDLGFFYGRRGQTALAVSTLRQALALDRAHGPATVDAASVLHDLHQEPALAIRALHSYLSSNAKSDAAPVFAVEVLLAKLLAESGDTASARTQLNAALALASGYAPAGKALATL